MVSVRLREPLILPCVALVCGILLDHFLPGDCSGPAIGVLLAVLLATLSRRPLPVLPAFFFAGILLSAVHTPGPAPQLDVDDNTPAVLAGCVVEPSLLVNDRDQFLLEIGPRARAQVKLYAVGGEALPLLQYGQRVEFVGKTRRPHNYRNPGAFDYAQFLARQNIYWSASASGSAVHVMPGECGNPFAHALSTVRAAALTRIEKLYRHNEYNTGMMQAVLVGETARLQRSWTDDYRSTGTFHALIISGSHVAVLAAALLFLLRICFVPRGAALLAVLVMAWAYAVITGWQPPVIRSAAGLTLYAVGGLFFRQRRTLNILAAVALLFFVFDPESLFDPSFQLSFFSVALIGLFVVPVIERTSSPLAAACRELENDKKDPRLAPQIASHRVELRLFAETLRLLLHIPERGARFIVVGCTRLLIFFYDLLLTSAAIQAGLMLPMVLYFHRVSFTGLSANAIVVPLLGVVVPLGFVTLFTGFAWLAKLNAGLLWVSQLTVAWHSRREPNWRIPDPPVWFSIVLVCVILLAAVRWKSNWLRAGLAVAAFVLMGALIVHPFPVDAARGVLELTVIDVGQGDSLLLVLPDQHTILIDAGGIATFGLVTRARNLDIGEDVVAPYLWRRGIRHIDVAAFTHLHDDHVQGFPAILKDFDVGEIWTGAVEDCPQWAGIQAIAAERHIPIRQLHRGYSRNFNDVQINTLAPSTDYVGGATPKNNDSLVLRVSYGHHSFLLTGDAEKQVEAQLVSSGELAHVDVLKAGHHGSRTSSTPGFLDALHPSLVLISDGYQNSYGHPHPLTIEHLSERHIGILRTDQSGLLTVKSDGHHLWAETPMR
jgi:competence protein ComEC